MTETIVHCFEAAGLGKAPFTYRGMVYQEMAYGQRVLGTVGGATMTTKPGSTCDYCGTYILNIFRVESADGKTFKVGCECIRKTGDEGLIRKVDEDIKKVNRQRKNDRAIARGKEVKAFCEGVMRAKAGTLSSLPHPVPYRASMGETLAHYARWMLENGHYGKLAAILREHA